MRSVAAAFVVLALATGCTHRQLARSTALQAATISDLQTRQVLDNVALFSCQPDAVPHFAVPAGGVVNVEDGVSGGGSLTFTPDALDEWGLSFGGSRSITGNWALAPINDPEKLYLLRCLFRHVVGVCDPECETALRHYFGDEYAVRTAPQGWFQCGARKDVPKGCPFGRYRDRYVWVTTEGHEALARVTLATLDVATVVSVVTPPPTREVTTFEYRNDLLIRQEKRIVVDQPAKDDGKTAKELGSPPVTPTPFAAPSGPRSRRDYADPYRGLFFVPRN